jgi:hypothetical protein
MQNLASLALVLGMLAMLGGRLVRVFTLYTHGTRLMMGGWVVVMLALPVAIPGLISKDPVLKVIYAVGAAGTALYLGVRLYRWQQERARASRSPAEGS